MKKKQKKLVPLQYKDRSTDLEKTRKIHCQISKDVAKEKMIFIWSLDIPSNQ
jgi:hypothetical protein